MAHEITQLQWGRGHSTPETCVSRPISSTFDQKWQKRLVFKGVLAKHIRSFPLPLAPFCPFPCTFRAGFRGSNLHYSVHLTRGFEMPNFLRIILVSPKK